MAILSENALLAQLSGKLGNIVIKRYKNKTVVTILPEKKDKAKRDPSVAKRQHESYFSAAVKYARDIIRNPALKKEYEAKVAPGQSVYNYAISEYMKEKGPVLERPK